MAIPEQQPRRNEAADASVNRNEQHSSVPNDLPDSAADRERLRPETTIINLPDVSDIPGQENVTVPRMESFMDTTPASDDEEGRSVFGDDAAYNDTTAHTSMGQDERGGDEAIDNTP